MGHGMWDMGYRTSDVGYGDMGHGTWDMAIWDMGI